MASSNMVQMSSIALYVIFGFRQAMSAKNTSISNHSIKHFVLIDTHQNIRYFNLAKAALLYCPPNLKTNKIETVLSVSMYHLNQFMDSERSSIFLFQHSNQKLTVFSSLDLEKNIQSRLLTRLHLSSNGCVAIRFKRACSSRRRRTPLLNRIDPHPADP
jgi:hypothetical protein